MAGGLSHHLYVNSKVSCDEVYFLFQKWFQLLYHKHLFHIL